MAQCSSLRSHPTQWLIPAHARSVALRGHAVGMMPRCQKSTKCAKVLLSRSHWSRRAQSSEYLHSSHSRLIKACFLSLMKGWDDAWSLSGHFHVEKRARFRRYGDGLFCHFILSWNVRIRPEGTVRERKLLISCMFLLQGRHYLNSIPKMLIQINDDYGGAYSCVAALKHEQNFPICYRARSGREFITFIFIIFSRLI